MYFSPYILLYKLAWPSGLARRTYKPYAMGPNPKVMGSNPTMSNDIFNTVRECYLSNNSYFRKKVFLTEFSFKNTFLRKAKNKNSSHLR